MPEGAWDSTRGVGSAGEPVATRSAAEVRQVDGGRESRWRAAWRAFFTPRLSVQDRRVLEAIPPATSLNLAAIAHLAGVATTAALFSLIRLEARGLVARRVSTLDPDVSFWCLAGQTDPRAIGEVAA